MHESIVFLVRVQCRRKESSRSLSHLLTSVLYISSCTVMLTITFRWSRMYNILTYLFRIDLINSCDCERLLEIVMLLIKLIGITVLQYSISGSESLAKLLSIVSMVLHS